MRNQRRSPHQHYTKNHLVIKFQHYDLPKSYQINVNGYGKYTINVETNIARVKINRLKLSRSVRDTFDINKVHATNYSDRVKDLKDERKYKRTKNRFN